MFAKSRSNATITINVNGFMVERVDNIHIAVFNNFESHFQLSNIEHPGVENLNFKMLS